MGDDGSVRVERNGPVTTVILSRPEARNAVDRPTAEALVAAFRAFDEEPEAAAAVLWGEGGHFCAGAALPQTCLRQDRLSVLEQSALSETDALKAELAHGLTSLASPEIAGGVARFQAGAGRHGAFQDP
jgi:1,4-dihydroxy-2-naphthoyl-CoA synthase